MGNVETLIKDLTSLFCREKSGVTQEERSGRKAKDSDVKVKRWRIKEEEEEKRHDSWQEERWRRTQGQTWSVLTSMRLSLSSFWWHRQQLPLQQTAASAVTEAETDYLLHLQRMESDGHYQLM